MTDSTYAPGQAPVVIKKRGDRLVDTKLNTFATLNTLSLYLKQGQKFIVIDERSGEDLTQDVLMRINLQEDMLNYMRTLIRAGKLPHDLLDHHWFRGPIRDIGPHEIMLGQGCDYFPVDSIKVFDAIPATLTKKDYSRARVTERFQRSKQNALEKDQARVAAGKKGNDRLEGLTEDYGLGIEIDGIACRLHDTWLDQAIRHKKIIDAVFAPRSSRRIVIPAAIFINCALSSVPRVARIGPSTREFIAISRLWANNTDCMADDAVSREPLSAANSLLTEKNTGKSSCLGL
jgi:hypothetical protein